MTEILIVISDFFFLMFWLLWPGSGDSLHYMPLLYFCMDKHYLLRWIKFQEKWSHLTKNMFFGSFWVIHLHSGSWNTHWTKVWYPGAKCSYGFYDLIILFLWFFVWFLCNNTFYIFFLLLPHLPECHLCVAPFYLHQCHGRPCTTKSIGAFVMIHLLHASDDNGLWLRFYYFYYNSGLNYTLSFIHLALLSC